MSKEAGAKPEGMVLETERLLLRPFAPGDLEAFASVFADPEVTRFLGFESGSFDRCRRELEFWMDAYGRQGFGMLAVVSKAEGELIGRCGFARWEVEGAQEVELGCVLKREYWGRGLGTEAASALRDYGFQALGFTRLVSVLHPDDPASERVARKIGMTCERNVHAFAQRLLLFTLHRT